jgi:hypothetical protein
MRQLALAAMLASMATAVSAQQPAIESVATVKQLMATVVAPASNLITEASARPPAADAEWGRVANQALLLAETGNLLMIGSRVKDRGEWLQFSAALRAAAAGAMRAASAHDARGLLQARDVLAQACGQCHAKYLQKASLRVRAPAAH